MPRLQRGYRCRNSCGAECRRGRSMTVDWLPRADGTSPWSQVHVVVAGIGVSGFAAADGLLEFGARVTVLDDRADSANTDKATLLETLGGTVRLSPGSAKAVPWLGITGTNGKTTTTQMLAAILSAAGLRTAAVGNIGRPITEMVLDREGYDVLAVELSSHQLHWSHSLALQSAAVLNVQPDHLEWHGSYAAYTDAKATIYERVQASCVYNVADPETERMVEEAEVVEGARAIGFTLGTPGLSMLGVVDDLLVDRAFIEQRRSSAQELARGADVPGAARRGPRRAAGHHPRPAQDSNCGRTRRGALGGRLQGHQPACRRCRPARLPAASRIGRPGQDRLDRRRAGG